MKRIVLFICALFCAITGFSQLKVKSDGTISAGSPFGSNTAINTSPQILVGSRNSQTGIELERIYITLKPGTSFPITAPEAYFIEGFDWDQTYFTTTSKRISTFRVRTDGEIFTGSGLVQLSDSTDKGNIETLPSAMNKISSLRGVSFNYLNKTDRQQTTTSKANSAPQPSNNNVSNSPIAQQIQVEQSRKRIGLIAQEVEAVIPEVVRTQPDGHKGIMYTDLIAVLIEGMKEQQDSIGILNERIRRIEDRLLALENNSQSSRVEEPSKALSENFRNKMNSSAILYQNTPNPFNQATEIVYKLPADVQNASLCIYNLNGQMLKKYPLEIHSLNDRIRILASEFNAGMYIYALIVNNQMVDSKRMTLTD